MTINPANTTDTIAMSLIRIFNDGPEVSLNGSPTVSPTTLALCGSEPLPPRCPISMYFLALSHAPPALAMKMASAKPLVSPPVSRPMTPPTPSTSPTMTGAAMAMIAGTIISFWAPAVEIFTHSA